MKFIGATDELHEALLRGLSDSEGEMLDSRLLNVDTRLSKLMRSENLV